MVDRPHLDWQQLSSTDFSHGAAKKEKFARPESSSSPHHTVSGLRPKKAVFIIRGRRDLNVKITVQGDACWCPPHNLPISLIAICCWWCSLILSPIPQVIRRGGGELLCHAVLLIILVDYSNTATETCSSSDHSFHKMQKCSSQRLA